VICVYVQGSRLCLARQLVCGRGFRECMAVNSAAEAERVARGEGDKAE
jgi:hypothetical protein